MNRGWGLENLLHVSLALFLLAVIYYFYFLDPVNYTRLVTEDQPGEYTTFVCFEIAGGFFFLLASKNGPYFRKIMWGTMGVVALLIAGEEISWGQRIFGISTPEFFLKTNIQKEFNFHNISVIQGFDNKRVQGWLVLGWTIFSGVTVTKLPSVSVWLERYGAPIIPLSLIPLFSLVPYFSLMSKSSLIPFNTGELTELILSIAVLAWVLHSFHYYGYKIPCTGGMAGRRFVGIFFVVGLLALSLTYGFQSYAALNFDLNKWAVPHYATYHMYAQAEKIFEYISKRPYLADAYTSINHGLVLMQFGRRNEAYLLLEKAAKQLEESGVREGQDVDAIRRLGMLWKLLGKDAEAKTTLAQAIALDRSIQDSYSDPDEVAHRQWSTAKTLEVSGEKEKAAQVAQKASDGAQSPALRARISRWKNGISRSSTMDKDMTVHFHTIRRLGSR